MLKYYLINVTRFHQNNWNFFFRNISYKSTTQIIYVWIMYYIIHGCIHFLVYDSSSKYPGGILNGEVTEFGNFDQCMRVSSTKFGIYGAYAVANMQFRFANSEVSEILDYIDADLEISNVTILVKWRIMVKKRKISINNYWF